MSGSGWSCTGSTCATSNVLAPGLSYPPIAVTVNVALTAPAQVTNQVSVLGGGSAAAGASDPTTIQPLLTSDLMSMSTPTSGSGCTPPPPAAGFSPTDDQALVWFLVNYANVGDQATANWYAPDGSLYTSAAWTPVSASGGSCFWDSINIAGSAPASEPGNWSVSVTWNGSPLFTQQFTIGTTQPVPFDFNHAGHPDVIWQDITSGLAQIWYLAGSQGVTLTGAADLTLTNPWRIVAVADFDGNGTPDVVW
jgi:hypothetical protein